MIYGFRTRTSGYSGSARGSVEPAQPKEQLPVAATGAGGREPPLRGRVRDDFQPPRPPRSSPDPEWAAGRAARHRQGELQGTGQHWRRGGPCDRAEGSGARGLGRGVPGEIVVVFAAGSDAEMYEEELRPSAATYRATGRGYFGKQQVVDLWRTSGCCTTATTTSRSPPCSRHRSSASRTTRSCSCAAARRGGRSTALERTLPEGIPVEEERLLRAFSQRYERLVRVRRARG